MPTKHTNEEGEEIDVFTAEEVASQLKEKDEALAKTTAEIENLRKVSAEKTENFKKLNEMTEVEKSKLTAQQIEDRKRIEAAESEVTKLREEKNSDTQTRIKNDTESALFKYHGGDEKLKAELEKCFKLVALEGNDTATIQERARLAKNMYVGQTGQSNPLFSSMHGDAPRTQQKNKTDEFLKSDKAQEALRRMGETNK